MRTLKAPRVNLAVTPELIADAIAEDSSHCMIAEAVKAALPHVRHVSVDIQTIRFSDPQNRVRFVYLTPRLGQTALVRFDAGDKIEPFRMQLRDPHITPMNPPRSQRKPAAVPLTEHDRQVADAKRERLADARERKARVQAGRGGTSPKLVRNGKAQPGPKGGGTALPRLEGGNPPPTAALASGSGRIPAGRRRQYGIRALDRGSALLVSDKGE
jgi:hypothetical protein